MVGAFGWAFMNPVRKLYYNLAITGISVVVAALVGGIEALGLAAEKLGLAGGLWASVGAMEGHFGTLGYLVVGIFVVTWIVTILIYRMMGYHKIPTPTI